MWAGLSDFILAVHLPFNDSFTTFNDLILHVKTTSSNAVLLDISMGDSTTGPSSLELRQGELVYRRVKPRPFTLVVDAHINDGLWHQLKLSIKGSSTRVGVVVGVVDVFIIILSVFQLSVDGGRVFNEVAEGGGIELQSFTIGAPSTSTTSSSAGFQGCLGNIVLNVDTFDVNTLSFSRSQFTSVHEGVVVGCGSTDSCIGGPCPTGSTCRSGYSCECTSPVSGECRNPCQPTPCQNSGTCSVSTSFDSAPFICDCAASSNSGPLCDVEGCGLGYYSSPCQPCLCSPEGTRESVCDAEGNCLCEVSDVRYNSASM